MNGQAPASGRPTQNSSGSASSAARKWTSAVSTALSPLDLISAFHDGVQQGAAQHREHDRPGHACRGVRQQAARGAAEEVGQRRRREVRLLREVVPLAQQHRVAGARLVEEAGRLLGGERRPLQREAALRIVGQARVVARIGRAQVALGVDVQLDRHQHRIRQQAAQERQREVLVGVVDAAQGRRVALLVQQVAEVVQQAGGDQRVVGVRLLGQVRGLQRMLKLGDRLPAVLRRTVAGEQQFDVGEVKHVRSPACRGSRGCRDPGVRVPPGRARRAANGGCGSSSARRPTRGSDRRSSRCAN